MDNFSNCGNRNIFSIFLYAVAYSYREVLDSNFYYDFNLFHSALALLLV